MWIIYRDAERAGARLAYGSSPLYSASPNDLARDINALASRKGSAERAPISALNAAIIQDEVKALGETTEAAFWGIGRRIAPRDWEHMQSVDGVRGHPKATSVFADTRFFNPMSYAPEGLRLNVRFDRQSVVATFLVADPIAVMVVAAPTANVRSSLRASRAKAVDYFSKFVAEHPGGPPSADWRREKLVAHLMEKFGLADGGARSVRRDVLDASLPKVKAAWATAGPPHKPSS